MAVAQDAADLIHGFRQHHQHRHLPVGGQPVRLERPQPVRIDDDALARHDGARSAAMAARRASTLGFRLRHGDPAHRGRGSCTLGFRDDAMLRAAREAVTESAMRALVKAKPGPGLSNAGRAGAGDRRRRGAGEGREDRHLRHRHPHLELGRLGEKRRSPCR